MLGWKDGHEVPILFPCRSREQVLYFWKGNLKHLVQAILSPNDVFCQILIESTEVTQILIDFFLNISWFAVKDEL